MGHIPMEKTILGKWLKAGYMERHVFHETTEGTPQGGIASPAMANRTLDGLEQHIRRLFPSARAYQRAKVHVIRYADLCRTGHNTESGLSEAHIPGPG